MYIGNIERRKNSMNVSYTLDIDDKIKDKLERIADSEHRTLAGQIRLILEEYLEKVK